MTRERNEEFFVATFTNVTKLPANFHEFLDEDKMILRK